MLKNRLLKCFRSFWGCTRNWFYNKQKNYLNFGAGYPCAGHNKDNSLFIGTFKGRDMTDGIRGAVLETGSI